MSVLLNLESIKMSKKEERVESFFLACFQFPQKGTKEL